MAEFLSTLLSRALCNPVTSDIGTMTSSGIQVDPFQTNACPLVGAVVDVSTSL
jgi:hypothetical protein